MYLPGEAPGVRGGRASPATSLPELGHAGMHGNTLQQRLQEAEARMQRGEQDIIFQQYMIAHLDRGGHDVQAAKMFLRWLEDRQAKLVAERKSACTFMPVGP
jgi:hypothetical protein